MKILIFILILIIVIAIVFWFASAATQVRYSEWTFSNSNIGEAKLLITDSKGKNLVNTTVPPDGNYLFTARTDQVYNIEFENSSNPDFSINLQQYTNSNNKVVFDTNENFHIAISGADQTVTNSLASITYTNDTGVTQYLTLTNGTLAFKGITIGTGSTTYNTPGEFTVLGLVKSNYVGIALTGCVTTDKDTPCTIPPTPTYTISSTSTTAAFTLNADGTIQLVQS